MKKILFSILAIVLVVGLALAMVMPALADGPSIWTDKTDYAPGDTVTISGSGFNALTDVTITVERPIGVDILAALTDDAGSFTCTYPLNGIFGTYTVTATDGTNSASTTFTDAVSIAGGYTTGAAPGTYSSAPAAKNAFLTTDDVNAVVQTGGGSNDKTVHLYVLNHVPSNGENLGSPPSKDVSSDGYETVTVNLSNSYYVFTIWSTPTAGTYYFVLDDGNDQFGGGDFSSSFSVTSSDTTAPVGSITINGDTTYTNSTSVTLNLAATDAVGVTGYRVANGTDALGASTTSVTSTTSFSDNIPWTLPSGDGSKTVAVQYRDAAANWSSNYTDSIILDTTAPVVAITQAQNYSKIHRNPWPAH